MSMEPIPEGMDPVAFMHDKARAHAERHKAMAEVAGHELSRLLSSLTADQLSTMASLLDTIGTSRHPARIAAFYTGRVLTMRELKYGTCVDCGSKHDDPSELLKDESVDVPPHVQARRKLDSQAENSIWVQIGSADMLQAHELSLMNKFNLDDLREEGTGKLLGFICLGCQTRYVSIEDRIKQPPGPEGCSGCAQKAKWG